MTPDPRIAEIKKRLAAATPGPMLNILSAGTPTDFEPTTRTLSTYKLAVIATKVRDGDAALFAHAQIDLAFLLSDRERLAKELDAEAADKLRWRKAFMGVTPSGSEYMDPQVCIDFVQYIKTEMNDAIKKSILLERDRERAIDEAVKGERERLIRVVRWLQSLLEGRDNYLVSIDKFSDFVATLPENQSADIELHEISEAIRRPTDTESGG